MRIFVAIDLPSNTKNDIHRFVEKAIDSFPQIKWVPKANYHITLSFIGEANQLTIEQLKSRLKETAREVEPFTVQVNGVAIFPSKDKPRIIALLISKNKDLVDEFGMRISEVSGGKYKSAHITIGRTKEDVSAEDIQIIEDKLAAVAIPFKVEKVKLFQSETKPTGAEYTVLNTFTLGD